MEFLSFGSYLFSESAYWIGTGLFRNSMTTKNSAQTGYYCWSSIVQGRVQRGGAPHNQREFSSRDVWYSDSGKKLGCSLDIVCWDNNAEISRICGQGSQIKISALHLVALPQQQNPLLPRISRVGIPKQARWRPLRFCPFFSINITYIISLLMLAELTWGFFLDLRWEVTLRCCFWTRVRYASHW